MGHSIEPIVATLDSLGWMVGRWRGEHDADLYEEWWAEPGGGTMVGMFRWIRNEQPRFYELMTIEPEADRVVFRIKHFGPGLIGWEEKDAPVTLDLVQLEKSEARFLKRGEERWMTYRADADDGLVAFFETADEPHTAADEFRYARR